MGDCSKTVRNVLGESVRSSSIASGGNAARSGIMIGFYSSDLPARLHTDRYFVSVRSFPLLAYAYVKTCTISANGLNVDGPTPTSMPLPEGQQPRGQMLGDRYEIFETIGSGMLGKVYRAWDHQVERVVAIKILAHQLASERRVAEVFEKEAARLVALPDHPDIVSVYEVRSDGDEPFVVMQFVPGGNLRDLLRRQTSLPFDEAFRIGRQIGLGLDFALRYGLIHGDLKPENVLIPHNGHAKVTDYGVWDVLQHSQATRPLFADARNPYTAPEVERGAKPDQRSDIYSLGALLFEMLTGSPPAQFGMPLYDALVHSTAALPPSAAEVVMRALEENPDNRYRTPGAFAAALHEHLLQEKGETPTYFYMPPVSSAPRNEPVPPPPSIAEQEISSAPVPAAPSAAQPPLPQPASPGRPVAIKKRRSIGFTSAIWLLVVLLAMGGGLYAYRAVNHLVNGSSQSTPPAAAVPPHIKHPAGTARHRNVIKPTAQSPTGGCATAQTGDVRLTNIYMSEIRPRANQPVTLSYTVSNTAPQCRRVVLHFRALSTSPSGTVLSGDTGNKLTSALPGVHVLQRSFVFPASAVGQRFDAEFTVTDPTGNLSYGIWRAPGLILVS